MKRNPDHYRFHVVTGDDDVFAVDADSFDAYLAAAGYDPNKMQRFGYLPDMPVASALGELRRLAEAEELIRELRLDLERRLCAYDTAFLSDEEVERVNAYGPGRASDAGQEQLARRTARLHDDLDRILGAAPRLVAALWPTEVNQEFETLFAFVRAGERRTLRRLVRALARQACGIALDPDDAFVAALPRRAGDAASTLIGDVGNAVWSKERAKRSEEAIASSADLPYHRSIDDVTEYLDVSILRARDFGEDDMVAAISLWETPPREQWRNTALGVQAVRRYETELEGLRDAREDPGVEWYFAAEYLHHLTGGKLRDAVGLKKAFQRFLRERRAHRKPSLRSGVSAEQ